MMTHRHSVKACLRPTVQYYIFPSTLAFPVCALLMISAHGCRQIPFLIQNAGYNLLRPNPDTVDAAKKATGCNHAI